MRVGACELCNGKGSRVVYRGSIRAGAYGNLHEDAEIRECESCGVQRLEERLCLPDSFYETETYRRKLQQALDGDAYFRFHDAEQVHWLRALGGLELRGMSLADVGCGAGSFLDHIAGLVNEVIAVEPLDAYREVLADRGYKAYPYAESAAAHGIKVDCAVSFQVIEHVGNPLSFLSGIREIMRDDAVLVVTTPNRNDILMRLLPEEYPSFFYREAHRWYFDRTSLSACAERAGFEVESIGFIHRFGLSNAFYWLSERVPMGRRRADGIDELIDSSWIAYLEDKGSADTLVARLRIA